MIDPKHANDYEERDAQAAYSVLIELGQVLGSYRDKFVLVGGAVPWLTYRDVHPSHIGTIDLDLNLDPEGLGDGEYASFVELLEEAGYQRNVEGLKDFQLQRIVQPQTGSPVKVIVDLLMPREAKGDKNSVKLIENFRVQGVDGGGIALKHASPKRFDGTMPDGQANSVQILVATIPALLVMKGFAIDQRDKPKDAYDIYFSIRTFEGGPEALGRACKDLLGDPVAVAGYRKLQSKFRSLEDFGPGRVRAFLDGSSGLGVMTADQVQQDAFGQVKALFAALELPEN